MKAEPKVMLIPAQMAGKRLDQALARMFPEYSRSRLKAWLLSGAVTVDGKSPRPSDAVDGGERVEVRAVAEPAVAAAPELIGLDVIYEDAALMVVNKPAGLVVHPGAGNARGTLMNGLLNHASELQKLPRAGIVHRLDKDTSGLLLIGKTLETHTALVRQLAERAIARFYVAVCNGVLTGGGIVDEPIGRHPVDRKRMCIRQDGRPAVTRYTVLERFRAHTYISVSLETGRTHQIRVHLAHRRHALLGDPTYGGRLALPARASDALIDTLRTFKRQALHATRLEFAHPVSGETLRLEAPPPADFEALLAVLRKDAS
ncbi:MAG: 23S rRNA pseudouridine(1911/1915/1917) synthase RluD [Gammaproteobacteria bacterium]|nr:23S rRNA pseudouridine(1911/1915/1917) synthase RluD [Gammaproteobacteria bacterium]MDH5303557.1 23S rRNA pseudouridine(1911/1915/1917) synthase RluD [Gammaproteobacteria bacterium]MDH5322227.1 23S rRNA pseudouridine(1911/1915/1917) synthase RluD [Gammaproteobacteria bacterium]